MDRFARKDEVFKQREAKKGYCYHLTTRSAIHFLFENGCEEQLTQYELGVFNDEFTFTEVSEIIF